LLAEAPTCNWEEGGWNPSAGAMTINKEYYIPPYEFKLTVWVGDDLYLLHNKAFGRQAKASFITNAAYSQLKGMQGTVLVTDCATVGEIAHEAEHIKNHLLHTIGHKPKYKNDEVDAYTIQYIADLIMETINESQGESVEDIQPIPSTTE
jgi:hypothetical protein